MSLCVSRRLFSCLCLCVCVHVCLCSCTSVSGCEFCPRNSSVPSFFSYRPGWSASRAKRFAEICLTAVRLTRSIGQPCPVQGQVWALRGARDMISRRDGSTCAGYRSHRCGESVDLLRHSVVRYANAVPKLAGRVRRRRNVAHPDNNDQDGFITGRAFSTREIQRVTVDVGESQTCQGTDASVALSRVLHRMEWQSSPYWPRENSNM